MQQLFWAEAGRNNILPLHDLTEGGQGRPTLSEKRSKFIYYPGITRVPHSAAPPVVGRSYSIEADIVVPSSGANGVMVAQGGRFGGYSFYLKDGRPVFHYNALGQRQYKITAINPVDVGLHKLTADFVADGLEVGGGGLLTYLVSGVIGAFVGGWLFSALKINLNIGSPIITQIITSTVGAIIVVVIARLIAG